jgi:hypothetical protein
MSGSQSMSSRDGDTERRDASTSRVQFEALVEVGSGSIGGFEAESVDVSSDGMRLRTAYLPEPGETLVCRFDGLGAEVVAEGQVVWCRTEARGGEFGVRFTQLDAPAAEMLRSLCAPAADEVEPARALAGARVRLHIQGLGSPMRARVRETARGEVLIGSNLEFLRVGRDVELEEVERGDRRVACIEHVGVEIDPDTSIPQLVVALRYLGVEEPDGAELSTAPYRVQASAGAAVERTPEPAVVDSAAGEPDARARAEDGAPSLPPPVATMGAAAKTRAEPDAAGADGAPEAPGRGLPAMLAARAAALVRAMWPTLASARRGAGRAARRLAGVVRRRRDGRAEREDSPRRMTAPPPTGALRSTGRRLVREPLETDGDMDGEAPATGRPGRNRRRALAGALLGLLATVVVYVAASELGQRGARAPAAVGASDAARPAPVAQPAAPAVASAVATAEVPLFGPTPLSTTEPVPAPPPGVEHETPEDGEPPGKQAADKAPDALPIVEPDADAKPPSLQREWGVGEVLDPVVLKIKMDGDIVGIAGSEGSSGFTIVVPDRKSVSSASALARKDKRIEAVNVVNYPDRAEVTVQFKGEVPPYLAKADGKRLVIEIGNAKRRKNAGAATRPVDAPDAAAKKAPAPDEVASAAKDPVKSKGKKKKAKPKASDKPEPAAAKAGGEKAKAKADKAPAKGDPKPSGGGARSGKRGKKK